MTWTKIDDTVVSDDASASTHVAYALRRNVAGLVTDRHMGCSVCYDEDAPPVLSTHPDYWYAIPLLLPSTVGAETLDVTLAYEVTTTESVDVALRVEGVQSSTSTLTTTTGLDTVELSVAVPGTRTRRWWRGELLVRSHVAASATGTVWISNPRFFGRVITGEVQTGVWSGSGKTHVLLEMTTQDPGGDVTEARYHVERVVANAIYDGDAYVWPPWDMGSPPAPTVPAKQQAGFWYELGVITVRSIGLRYDGDSGTLVTSTATATEPGRPVRSSHVRRTFDVLDTLRRDRRRWWAASLVTRSGTGQTSREDAIGATPSQGDSEALEIGSAIVERRVGAGGVRVAVLAAQIGDGRQWTMRVSLGGTDTEVVVTPARRIPEIGGTPRIGYSIDHEGLEFGGIDAGLADEVHLMSLHEVVVPWGTLAVGDQGLLVVEIEGYTRTRAFTCCIIEEF